MKNYFSIISFFIISLLCGPQLYAYDEDNEYEEFGPINKTLAPGAGILKWEETATDNTAVYLSGEELCLSSKNAQSASASTIMPINPIRDFKIQFTLNLTECPKASSWGIFIMNSKNSTYSMSCTQDKVFLYENQSLITQCKYKPGKNSTTNFGLTKGNKTANITIEKKGKVLTYEIDGTYLFEIDARFSLNQLVSGIIYVDPGKKKKTLKVTSINLQQSGGGDDDD